MITKSIHQNNRIQIHKKNNKIKSIQINLKNINLNEWIK